MANNIISYCYRAGQAAHAPDLIGTLAEEQPVLRTGKACILPVPDPGAANRALIRVRFRSTYGLSGSWALMGQGLYLQLVARTFSFAAIKGLAWRALLQSAIARPFLSIVEVLLLGRYGDAAVGVRVR